MAEVNVSIIIPTYNVAPYIRKCLESVAAQNYTGSIECLIVDDCGPDNSIQIAEDFIKEYSGPIDFRIFKREKNGGLSAARNSGIREARGEYLYFLDSDDCITPDCIQSMWLMVERFPCVECVFAGANVVGGLLGWMDYTKKDLPEFSNDRDWLQESMLKRYDLSMSAWNRLVSADFIRHHYLYFEEGFIHEDEIWNLLISQVITNAAFVKANTYNYIVRGSSIITDAKGDSTKYFRRHFLLWNKMVDYIKGYRKGLQTYYVVVFAVECLADIYTLGDYLKLMKVMIRALCKSDYKYLLKIIGVLWASNYLLITRICKK